jgi:predicted esterase
MVTHGMGLKARARLEDLGYGVQWEEYTMEHQVMAEEITALGIWLRGVLTPATI